MTVETDIFSFTNIRSNVSILAIIMKENTARNEFFRHSDFGNE
jgi:hypothetical protein